MRCTLVGAVAILLGLSVTLSFRGDTPDTLVARLSFTSNDVAYQRGDEPDESWYLIPVNTPLMTGDSVYVPSGGLAEVTLGQGNVVHASDFTQCDLLSLDRYTAQIGLPMGRADLKIRAIPVLYTVEVDTPGAAATVLRPGSYRFWASPDFIDFDVIEGALSVAVGGVQVELFSGESLELTGSWFLDYGLYSASSPDIFDRWAWDRDTRTDVAASVRFVNPDVVGLEDLDSWGHWIKDTDYGNVWVPSGIPKDWAPNQAGAWIWEDPFGWTWVSDEPWGWAPYHYGRWVCLDGTWGWVPPPPPGYEPPLAAGSISALYAPALVAFVIEPGSADEQVSGSDLIGWVPLAPSDQYYYPWQPAPAVPGAAFVRQSRTSAATWTRREMFGRGHALRVLRESVVLNRANLLGSAPGDAMPSVESLFPRPHERLSPLRVPSSQLSRRPLVARLLPPPHPVPFAQRLDGARSTGQLVTRTVPVIAKAAQPFKPGMEAPGGVRVISAYAPRGQGLTQLPDTISRPLLPMSDKAADRQAATVSSADSVPLPKKPRGAAGSGTPPASGSKAQPRAAARQDAGSADPAKK